MLFRAVLLISFLCIAICLAAKDYYEVLSVERGASTAQIKRAFKKLALKHHPDKSDDPKASEKFMEITTAYETLFNEDKRKAYDRMGHEAYVQSKKKGGTPEEEAAFTNFFRQSTASSPDHEGYFESFDKFFSGSFGPGHGGVFFGADGAPMFQSDEFLDLDDIIFNPFWNEDSGSHFGSGQSFFGGGHFKQHQQQRHQHQHQHQQQFSQARNQHRARQQFMHEGDGFFSMFDSDFGHFSAGSQGFHSGGASKKCVTTKYRNSDGHWVESTSCTVG